MSNMNNINPFSNVIQTITYTTHGHPFTTAQAVGHFNNSDNTQPFAHIFSRVSPDLTTRVLNVTANPVTPEGATSSNTLDVGYGIATPLEQFEVNSLISISAPILGDIQLNLTNLSVYALIVAVLAISMHILANNSLKLVPSK